MHRSNRIGLPCWSAAELAARASVVSDRIGSLGTDSPDRAMQDRKSPASRRFAPSLKTARRLNRSGVHALSAEPRAERRRRQIPVLKAIRYRSGGSRLRFRSRLATIHRRWPITKLVPCSVFESNGNLSRDRANRSLPICRKVTIRGRTFVRQAGRGVRSRQ
jgi:hypothetical protein